MEVGSRSHAGHELVVGQRRHGIVAGRGGGRSHHGGRSTPNAVGGRGAPAAAHRRVAVTAVRAARQAVRVAGGAGRRQPRAAPRRGRETRRVDFP